MPVLWTKSPDEGIFCRRFGAEEKKALEAVFSVTDADSPWRRALGLLSLPPVNEPLVLWHEDMPYFNSSAFVTLVSGGAIVAAKTDKGGYEFCVSRSLPHLWALLKGQWKIMRFMTRRNLTDDKIAESLALGLCLQSLVLQMGSSAERLAYWLAKPETAPPQYRRIVRQLQEVQVRRTGLSSAWNELFPNVHQADAAPEDLPDFFWDAPPLITAPSQSMAPVGPDFTGLPASGGQIAGRAVTDMKNIPNDGSPLILVFRQARPETVELFGHATGLIFAEGGVLSHACTVARERNIPAVTGVGAAFLDDLKLRAGAWVSIDGDTGMVRVLESRP